MSLHMSLVLTVDHYYVRIGLQCIPEVLTIPFVLSIRIRNRDLGDKPNWNFNANQSAGTLAEGNSRVKNRVAYERRCESKNIHKGINWKTQKMRRGKRPRSLWTAQRRLESSAHLRRAFPPFIGSPTAILPPPYH